MFSTSGGGGEGGRGYHEYIRGYHEYIGDVQYIGGIPGVHWGDIMSTSLDAQYIGGYHMHVGGYHEYIGGYSVHQGNTMSTSVGYHKYIGRYHE